MARDPSTDAVFAELDAFSKRASMYVTHFAPTPVPLGGDGYRNICDEGRDVVAEHAEHERAEGCPDVAEAIEAGQRVLAVQAEATRHRQRGQHAIANAIEAGIGHLAGGSGNRGR